MNEDLKEVKELVERVSERRQFQAEGARIKVPRQERVSAECWEHQRRLNIRVSWRGSQEKVRKIMGPKTLTFILSEQGTIVGFGGPEWHFMTYS